MLLLLNCSGNVGSESEQLLTGCGSGGEVVGAGRQHGGKKGRRRGEEGRDNGGGRESS